MIIYENENFTQVFFSSFEMRLIIIIERANEWESHSRQICFLGAMMIKNKKKKIHAKEGKKSCKKSYKTVECVNGIDSNMFVYHSHISFSLTHDNSHSFFNECRLLYELWYSWFIKHISTRLILILFFIILIVMSSNGSHPGTPLLSNVCW